MQSEIKTIIKRDGREVPFDIGRIQRAIFKAAQAVGGSDQVTAWRLAIQVYEYLIKAGNLKPTVEEVQDVVEKILIENGHAKTAKAYILYRDKRTQIRNAKALLLNIEKTISEYVNQIDWRIKENANVDYSHSGLMLHTAGSVIANYVLNNVYTPEIRDAHVHGFFHIHDLGMGTCGYCAGWSLKQLLLEGFNGPKNKVAAGPAKHFDTALGQMVNFLGTLQNEWAGAMAFNNFDTLLAPYVRRDKLSYKEVKQGIQQFIFSVNTTSRWGGQCVSSDTEILTKEGWKTYKELKEGELIATFNLQTHELEYQPIEKLNVYNYEGELLRFVGRKGEILVTPNHRIVRKKFNKNEYTITPAIELTNIKTSFSIPAAGEYKEGNEVCEDEFIQLCAWIIAEGVIPSSEERIVIYQSETKNPMNCERIRQLLQKLNIAWYEKKRTKHGFNPDGTTIEFVIDRPNSRILKEMLKNSKNRLPMFVKNTTSRQKRLFLEEYILADGYIETDNCERKNIYVKSSTLRDEILKLIVEAGFSATFKENNNGVSTIRIYKNKNFTVNFAGKFPYKGVVWCPTVKNNTFFARRNNIVFITGNSPFTNITLDFTIPDHLKKEAVVWGGKILNETYADYQKEVDMINKAFIEIMIEGDYQGRIFSFPIPTYNVTKEFDWESENTKLLFQMTAKYGTPYFQNFINSDLNPADVRSMCCRLTMNLRELKKKTGGLFGAGDATGSIGVVTLNMPRLAYLSKGDVEKFFKLIERYMFLAKVSLEIKRKMLENNLKKGLYPYTARYLYTFKNHFSTIGLVGMNEACLNLLGEDIASEKGRKLALAVLDFMRKKIIEFQEETGNLYNLEATPAEGTSYRLAKIDKNELPGIITAGTDDAPYYTNSTQLPVGYTDDPILALELQEELQTKYTGGTVFHLFLGEALPDAESCKLLVKRILSRYRIPYLSITPTFSVCPKHGYLTGEHWHCPKCGEECEVYSRVVGYYRPISNWNKGKQQEYRERRAFKIYA